MTPVYRSFLYRHAQFLCDPEYLYVKGEMIYRGKIKENLCYFGVERFESRLSIQKINASNPSDQGIEYPSCYSTADKRSYIF
jgi:hypothetical protein